MADFLPRLPPRLSRRSGQGFSLVDILAAVAVVGILAALLLPVLKQVLFRAQVAKNLANLRSLQEANIAYAADHDGAYVPAFYNDSRGGATIWYRNADFLAYLGIAGSAQGSWPAGMLSPRATLRQIFYSYGYNATDLPQAWGVPGAVLGLRVVQVTAPSKTLAFADALNWNISQYAADNYTGREVPASTGAVAYRYNGSAGIVYFDGHAEMLPRGQVVNNSSLWKILR